MTNWDKVKEMMDIEEFEESNPFCSAIHKLRQENDCSSRFCITCKKWLEQKYKPQILSESEREYLSAVIKPFRDRIKYVMKEENSKEEWISITMEAWSKQGIEDHLTFPNFQAGTMYKGMDTVRFYTLEELGL